MTPEEQPETRFGRTEVAPADIEAFLDEGVRLLAERGVRATRADVGRLLDGFANRVWLNRMRAGREEHTLVPGGPKNDNGQFDPRPSCTCGEVMPVGIKTNRIGWHHLHMESLKRAGQGR
jgi:hypothetical protein